MSDFESDYTFAGQEDQRPSSSSTLPGRSPRSGRRYSSQGRTSSMSSHASNGGLRLDTLGTLSVLSSGNNSNRGTPEQETATQDPAPRTCTIYEDDDIFEDSAALPTVKVGELADKLAGLLRTGLGEELRESLRGGCLGGELRESLRAGLREELREALRQEFSQGEFLQAFREEIKQSTRLILDRLPRGTISQSQTSSGSRMWDYIADGMQAVARMDERPSFEFDSKKIPKPRRMNITRGMQTDISCQSGGQRPSSAKFVAGSAKPCGSDDLMTSAADLCPNPKPPSAPPPLLLGRTPEPHQQAFSTAPYQSRLLPSAYGTSDSAATDSGCAPQSRALRAEDAVPRRVDGGTFSSNYSAPAFYGNKPQPEDCRSVDTKEIPRLACLIGVESPHSRPTSSRGRMPQKLKKKNRDLSDLQAHLDTQLFKARNMLPDSDEEEASKKTNASSPSLLPFPLRGGKTYKPERKPEAKPQLHSQMSKGSSKSGQASSNSSIEVVHDAAHAKASTAGQRYFQDAGNWISGVPVEAAAPDPAATASLAVGTSASAYAPSEPSAFGGDDGTGPSRSISRVGSSMESPLEEQNGGILEDCAVRVDDIASEPEHEQTPHNMVSPSFDLKDSAQVLRMLQNKTLQESLGLESIEVPSLWQSEITEKPRRWKVIVRSGMQFLSANSSLYLGVLPWSWRSRASRAYQFFVLGLLAAAAGKCGFRAFTMYLDGESVLAAAATMDMLLAMGALLSLLFVGAHRGSAALLKCAQLLRAYASSNSQHHHWEDVSDVGFFSNLGSWLLAVLIRSRMALLGWEEPRADIACFAFSAAVLMSVSSFLQHSCRCLVKVTDDFIFRIYERPDFAEAMQDWSVLYSLYRAVSTSIQHGFIALQATMIALVLLCVSKVGGHGNEMLINLVPGLVVAIPVVHTCIWAGAVTDKCARVPMMVNSISGTEVIDQGRMYCVQHISYSQAGFYIFDVRLTSSMILKTIYITSAVVFGLVTQVL